MAARIEVGMLGILRRLHEGAALHRQGRDDEEGHWTIRDRGDLPRTLARTVCESMVRMGLIHAEEPRRAQWYPRNYTLTDSGRAAAGGILPLRHSPVVLPTRGPARIRCPVVVAAEALVAAYEAAEAGLPPPGGIAPRDRFLELAKAVRGTVMTDL